MVGVARTVAVDGDFLGVLISLRESGPGEIIMIDAGMRGEPGPIRGVVRWAIYEGWGRLKTYEDLVWFTSWLMGWLDELQLEVICMLMKGNYWGT